MSMIRMMLFMKETGHKKEGESARHSTPFPRLPMHNNQKNLMNMDKENGRQNRGKL